ncbi:unnamed protein product, partial [Ectocarpus sp. 12 AP-2014]
RKPGSHSVGQRDLPGSDRGGSREFSGCGANDGGPHGLERARGHREHRHFPHLHSPQAGRCCTPRRLSRGDAARLEGLIPVEQGREQRLVYPGLVAAPRGGGTDADGRCQPRPRGGGQYRQ